MKTEKIKKVLLEREEELSYSIRDISEKLQMLQMTHAKMAVEEKKLEEEIISFQNKSKTLAEEFSQLSKLAMFYDTNKSDSVIEDVAAEEVIKKQDKPIMEEKPIFTFGQSMALHNKKQAAIEQERIEARIQQESAQEEVVAEPSATEVKNRRPRVAYADKKSKSHYFDMFEILFQNEPNGLDLTLLANKYADYTGEDPSVSSMYNMLQKGIKAGLAVKVKKNYFWLSAVQPPEKPVKAVEEDEEVENIDDGYEEAEIEIDE